MAKPQGRALFFIKRMMQRASHRLIANDVPQVSESQIGCIKRDSAGAAFILNLDALKCLRQGGQNLIPNLKAFQNVFRGQIDGADASWLRLSILT